MTDEKSTDRLEDIVGGSRRSFMKKGAIASGVLAFGVAGSGAVTAAGRYQQESQAVVFGYDYNPDLSFQVVASLEEDVVDAILGQQVDGEPIVEEPGDYSGYIIYYQQNGSALGECAFVFTHSEALQENQQYQFGDDAMLFVPRANLLEVNLSTDGDGGTTTSTETGTTTTGEATTTDGGTTTTEEGTTTTEGATATTTGEGTTATTVEEGATTTNGETTTTEDSGEDGGNGGGQANQAVVFGYDYNPDLSFQVVASLEEDVVDAILGQQVDGEPVVDEPGDYNAYVVYYQQDGETPGEFALVFTRDGTLQENQQYQLGTDAMTFIDRANLLEVNLSTGDGGATTTAEGATITEEGTVTTDGEMTATTEAETTTTEEGTTTSE